MKQTDSNGIRRLGPGDDLFGFPAEKAPPTPQPQPEPVKEVEQPSTTVEQSPEPAKPQWNGADFHESEYFRHAERLYDAVDDLYGVKALGDDGERLKRERLRRRIALGRHLRNAPPTAVADIFFRAMKRMPLR